MAKLPNIEVSVKDIDIVKEWALFIKEIADWDKDYSSTYLKLKARNLLGQTYVIPERDTKNYIP